MGSRTLPASILKKLNRRLKQHEGCRLRGRHSIEARCTLYGRRAAKTFSASPDVFENLEAALHWQAETESAARLAAPHAPQTSSPFRDWTITTLLERFQVHHAERGKISYSSHIQALLRQSGRLPYDMGRC